MKGASKFLAIVVISSLRGGCAGWAQVQNTPVDNQVQQYDRLLQSSSVQNDGPAWLKLATLYQDAARYGDAERAYSKAVDLLRTGDPATYANAIDAMGTMFVETGQYEKALPLERQALEIREAQSDSLGVGLSWMHLAMLSLGKHDFTSAAKYAESAADRLVPERTGRPTAPGATAEEKMTALVDLSLTRCAQGDCGRALPELKRAQSIALTSYGSGSFPVAYTSFLIGYARWKSGDDGSAAELMKDGMAGMESQLGWGHPTYIMCAKQYESFLRQTQRSSEVTEIQQKIARLSANEVP
jgi:tetratricopeptide (TPR) repeat protein